MEVNEVSSSGKPVARVSMEELERKASRRKAAVSSTLSKTATKIEAPPPEKVDPSVIRSTFKMAFHTGYIITSFEGWKLDDNEARYLQEAWQPVFDKYIAPRFAEYIIIFNAIGATGTLLFGKLKAQREWTLQNRQAAKKAEPPEKTQ